jgi:hypothetical protein
LADDGKIVPAGAGSWTTSTTTVPNTSDAATLQQLLDEVNAITSPVAQTSWFQNGGFIRIKKAQSDALRSARKPHKFFLDRRNQIEAPPPETYNGKLKSETELIDELNKIDSQNDPQSVTRFFTDNGEAIKQAGWHVRSQFED